MFRRLSFAALAVLVLTTAAPGAARASAILRGHVLDAVTGSPVPNARVRMLEPAAEALTDFDGAFLLQVEGPPEGRHELEASRVGYAPARLTLERLDPGVPVDFQLRPRPVPKAQVEVTATRAAERRSAVAFTELDRGTVADKYWAQDVPVLLAETPSVYAYSDAGNGMGYSYVKVRGFSQRRVAVTINGVPENDPESHEVYWVDHPDLLASTASLQVQRGAGGALYGSSAVGGSVNLETPLVPAERRLSLSAGMGSYNTRRYSVDYQSGLIDGRYAVSGRYSRLLTDGYRDQSWSDLWSYFLSAARLDQGVTTRINVYGGPEDLHLAYYGVDRSYLDGKVTGDADRDRRANPLDWNGETDHFFEPHYELIQNVRLSDAASFSHTLFFYSGEGYYDDRPYGPQPLVMLHLPEFEVADSTLYPAVYYVADSLGLPSRGPDGRFRVVNTDITQRLWVKNDHYGWVPRVKLAHAGGHGELTLGGEWREHTGRHYGELTWAAATPPGVGPAQRMYDYTGHVHVQSGFAQESYAPRPDLRLTASLQLRHTRYGIDHDLYNGYDFHLDYTFLNPRVGLNWNVDERWNAFASFARVSAEPILGEIYRADDPSSRPLFGTVDAANGIYENPLVHPEKLNDFEAGAGFRAGNARLKLTAFWMDFRDEIVPQGQIDRYGVPITGNAARSSHKGLELEGAARLAGGVELSGNLSWSRNRFGDYVEHVTADSVNVYTGNSIAGFPDLMANFEAAWRTRGARVALALAAVGRQYLDNTEDNRLTPAARSAPGYAPLVVDGHTVLNASASVDLGRLAGARGLSLEVHALNLADSRYETAGYVYSGVPYFFPASGRSVFASLKAEF